jgi:hypothetical protein
VTITGLGASWFVEAPAAEQTSELDEIRQELRELRRLLERRSSDPQPSRATTPAALRPGVRASRIAERAYGARSPTRPLKRALVGTDEPDVSRSGPTIDLRGEPSCAVADFF